MRKISSDKNPLYRQWLELRQSRGIKKFGQMVVSGRKLVPEFMQDPAFRPIALLTAPELPALPNPGRIHEFELEPKLFKELDAFGTAFPLLILPVPELEKADLSVPPRGLEILCAMSDPLNAGSLLRAAAAFRADRVIFLKESASPFHPRALRASAGTALRLKLASGPAIADIAGNPAALENLVVLDKDGADIAGFRWPRDMRLLIGEEGLGVPDELRRHQALSIPIAPGVESLNAVSAASIALYLARLNRNL